MSALCGRYRPIKDLIIIIIIIYVRTGTDKTTGFNLENDNKNKQLSGKSDVIIMECTLVKTMKNVSR